MAWRLTSGRNTPHTTNLNTTCAQPSVSATNTVDQILLSMYQKTEGITEDIHSDYKTTFNNHVVIVEQSGDSEDSWVKANLAPGAVYTQKDWNGGTLVVQVCSITPGTPDVAKVISFVDGQTTASCVPTTGGECVVTGKKFVVKSRMINECRWVRDRKTEVCCREKRGLRFSRTSANVSTQNY